MIHEQGLVSVLKQIHDDLDASVFDAYGWPHDLNDDEILRRLVDLNRERAEEEKRGHHPLASTRVSEPRGHSGGKGDPGRFANRAGIPQSIFSRRRCKTPLAQDTARTGPGRSRRARRAANRPDL